MRQIYILFLVIFQISYSQSDDYNLGFENSDAENNVSNWNVSGNFKLIKDSTTVHFGKYSVLIADSTNTGILGIRNEINGSFKGQNISLEGYMKTENANGAYAFLILGTEKSQLYHNIGKALHGNNDWTKFEIILPFSEEITKITIAGNLEGSGKVWFDNFSVKIDGIDITKVDEIMPSSNVNSNFHIDDLSKSELNNLVLLGKIWGFLKYYHPAVSKGDLDWDKQLFTILPSIKKDSFQNELLQWIQQFDPKDLKPGTYSDENLSLERDINWISDRTNLNENLVDILKNIRNAERQNTNYYLALNENTGTIKFRNEKIYPQMSFDDDGMKLLALFRFWNTIEYFYPYRNLISVDWDSVLIDFIPKMIKADTELDYKLTLLELVGKVEDTRSTITTDVTLINYLERKLLLYK